MNYKDQYESEFDGLEDSYDFMEYDQESETDMYVKSANYLSDRVLEIFGLDVSDAEKIDRINSLRRTSFNANLAYYPKIWGMSYSRSKLNTLMLGFRKLLKMNSDFFASNELVLVFGDDKSIVKTKGGSVFIEVDHVGPDALLQEIGITPDNQVDYHLMAGYLLRPKNNRIVQTAQAILKTSEKIDHLLRMWR